VVRPEQTEGPYFVDARLPYAGSAGRRTRNAEDRIFRRGGEQLLLSPVSTGGGYEAAIAIGLQIPE